MPIGVASKFGIGGFLVSVKVILSFPGNRINNLHEYIYLTDDYVHVINLFVFSPLGIMYKTGYEFI